MAPINSEISRSTSSGQRQPVAGVIVLVTQASGRLCSLSRERKERSSSIIGDNLIEANKSSRISWRIYTRRVERKERRKQLEKDLSFVRKKDHRISLITVTVIDENEQEQENFDQFWTTDSTFWAGLLLIIRANG